MFRNTQVFNPYASIDLSKNNPAYLLLYNLESIICQSANHVICVSELSRDNYIKYYKTPENKVTCITNGYDEDDFRNIDFTIEKNKKFIIYYGGLNYSKERNFEPIFQALYELIKDKKIEKSDILFKFSGYSSIDINKIIEKYDLKNNTITNNYQKHEIVLNEMVESDLLICMVGDGERYHSVYPGKIFEYLRSCRPILALASPEGLVGKLLDYNKHGKAILSTDLIKIKEYILEQYNIWKTSNERIYCDSSNIINFERKVLTKKLNDTFFAAMENINSNSSKKEISSYLYDVYYLKGGPEGNYFKNYKESIYYNSWLAAIRRLLFLNKDVRIIEIGCGVGQFANMLFDFGYTNYKGLDYSKTAIDMAKKNNPMFSENFINGDAFTDNIFNEDYEVAILFEILEHINDDIKVFNRIKHGTKVLFSVPNFSDPTHIRYFSSSEEVLNRYIDVIDILDIQLIPLNSVNVLYLVTGIKK